jgi:hypothetical protein
MTIRTNTHLLEQPLVIVEHRGEVRTLMRIDPDREHSPTSCLQPDTERRGGQA